jgi:hypothetical protein
MVSIWFFLALVVAFVAIHLLRHRDVVHATHAPDGKDMIGSHDGKADGCKRGNGCCH